MECRSLISTLYFSPNSRTILFLSSIRGLRYPLLLFDFIGVDNAKIILCTIPDDLLRGLNNQQLVATVRRLNPNAIIIANAVQTSSAEEIYDAGADYIYMTRVETARSLENILGHALAGTLDEFKDNKIEQCGHIAARREVLT